MKTLIKKFKNLFVAKKNNRSTDVPKKSITDPKYASLINSYTKLGIDISKLIIAPSDIVIWSKSKQQIVKEMSSECEVIHMQVHSVLNNLAVETINNSKGIVITDEIWGKGYWRFGFIPQN